MLMRACEFLCASRFEIEEVSLRPWDYTDSLVQQLIKAFASQPGFKAFNFILFSDQYAGLIGPFLKGYLKSELLSKEALSEAIYSGLGSGDAVFDALWTSTGLCFVLACTNHHDLPMPWLTRFREACVREMEINDSNNTSGDCPEPQYLTSILVWS